MSSRTMPTQDTLEEMFEYDRGDILEHNGNRCIVYRRFYDVDSLIGCYELRWERGMLSDNTNLPVEEEDKFRKLGSADPETWKG